MSVRSLNHFRKLIDKKEWVKGAVNYDEDLHFSTFYLRASHARHTAPLYPGYMAIFAFYEGFHECYYLLKSECLHTATAIVARAIRQPAWLPRILETIERRSDALSEVFAPETSPAWLANLSNKQILSLYQKHAASEQVLYKYARLPEALDRGDAYFSDYLQNYLRKLGLSTSAREQTFAILSQPTVPSVLAQELLEFEQIVRQAAGDKHALLSGSQGRARMFLRPELLRRLRAHQEKWKFLTYHGYGRRETATLEQYIERLVQDLHKPLAHDHAPGMHRRASQAEQERREVLKTLRMDRAHQALFAVYPQIGAAKLYRRYAQLRNFYYLDMLLADIAARIDVSEWTLRCMLPEEIVASVKVGKLADPAVRERGSHCMYALLADRDCVVAGDEASQLSQLFQAKTRTRQPKGVLKGSVACRGKITGPCKVIIRADDVREEFARGTILVSESTDPDLVRFLKNAGGVLTEQGGVTSHAALICRELGIPTIIGIEGLLERVHTGDVLEVDAERGFVTLVQDKVVPPPRMAFSRSDARSPDVIGAKAYNLGVIRSLGFPVPEYVVVRYDGVKRLMEQPSNGSCNQLVKWTLQELNLPAADKVALRSSAVNEDRQEGSNAGMYCSLLDISRDHLAEAFHEFVKSNGAGKNGSPYRGSIIVQRMIQPDYAGVCLTSDAATANDNRVTIEFMPGSNESITQGTALPDRIVIDRLTGDIVENQRRSHACPPGAIDLADLMQQFLTLEGQFGTALDIEWALADRKLYILQARPLVQHAEAVR